MKRWWAGGAAATAVLGMIAACSSDNDTTAGSSSGNGADGGSVGIGDSSTNSSSTSRSTSSSGSSSSSSTSSSSSSSSSGSSGDDDSGTDSGTDAGPTVTITATPTLPGAPGAIDFNATTNELWVTTSVVVDGGTRQASLVVLDGTSFSLKRTVTSGPGQFGPIVVAADSNSVYFARSEAAGGGFRAEVDRVDANNSVSTVTTLTADFEGVDSLAYDGTLHRLYVASSGGYLQMIDTTTNTLTTTFPTPTGLGGFNRVAVSPGSGQLFLLARDMNSVPLTATFDTATSTLGNVISGQDAGWSTALGPAVVATDGGANAVVGVQLKDGGAELQELDPGIRLLPGDKLEGVFAIPYKLNVNWGYESNVYAVGSITVDFVVTVTNACGKKVLRFFSTQTGEMATWDDIDQDNIFFFGKDPLTEFVQTDLPTVTGNDRHFAVVTTPTGTGDEQKPTLTEVTVTMVPAQPAVKCP